MIEIFVLFKIFQFKNYYYYIDFKTNRHVNNHKKIFHKFFKLNHFIIMFDFNKKNIITKSNILKIKILINEKSRILIIFDILFIFDFLFNFFIIKIFEKKNLHTIFDKKNC